MPLSKTKLSESDVSTEIDIESLLGSAGRDKMTREVFFQAAFDVMLERLEQGRDVNGKLMSKYSKEYKESDAYNVFGKDGTVNMQLRGDMINSLAEKKSSKNKMVIGFVGDEQNAKAYAHMTGYKGHPTIRGVKPREFFGWTDKELKAIANELKPSNSSDILQDDKLLALLDRFFK